MLQKLSEEKLNELLECGISEFAEHGMSAGMSSIARRAGTSVGVIYKYYEDKEDFFLACVRHSLSALETRLMHITQKRDKPLHYARALISTLQYFASEHSDYIRMYHRITEGSEQAPRLAAEIEGFTSRLYSDFISAAQKAGDIRQDIDPGLFAFFFDNLLMMLQFSYCCPYYKERFKIYGGSDILENNELVTDQLLKFIESAFTFEQADITHRNGE